MSKNVNTVTGPSETTKRPSRLKFALALAGGLLAYGIDGHLLNKVSTQNSAEAATNITLKTRGLFKANLYDKKGPKVHQSDDNGEIQLKD